MSLLEKLITVARHVAKEQAANKAGLGGQAPTAKKLIGAREVVTVIADFDIFPKRREEDFVLHPVEILSDGVPPTGSANSKPSDRPRGGDPTQVSHGRRRPLSDSPRIK